MGKTSCIAATEYSGSPAPPLKCDSTEQERIVLDSDEDLKSHETRLSRMSQESFEFEISASDWLDLSVNHWHQTENQNQSPVRDRQSKKRNYSGKTTCIPATEYSGSPDPPTKNNSSRVKEKIPKFDVANENDFNDFNDFENSNSLFDEVGFQIRVLIGPIRTASSPLKTIQSLQNSKNQKVQSKMNPKVR